MTLVTPILMYHEITPSLGAANRLAVPQAAFAAQLAHLHEEGFTTLTASALAQAVSDGSDLPDRTVAITFDDGFADVHEVALPLLNRFNFTATVYVTTDWIEDGSSQPVAASRRPGRMLTWEQIHDLAEAGIEIGAHSCSHPELDQLRHGQLQRELWISKQILEAELGHTVPGMAYPYGYSTAAVRQMARDVGYGYACIVGNSTMGEACDPFALPRLTVRRSTSAYEFDEIVHARGLRSLFLKDHVLTKGWSAVRRARAMINNSSGD